ncbi:MAG: nucleotide exchange factor GrpE [Candidatus Bathyarchaeota archaeon]|jgi:molecular chaperone GrpE
MTTGKSKTKELEERIAELESSLDEVKTTSERYLKQLKYAKADLENLQKRTQKIIDEALDRANSRLIMQLLPILDELDLAIDAAKNSKGNILEGVEMIRGKVWKVMETEGVMPIESTGKAFDPNFHEAVLEVETNEIEEGYVTEEYRKGYKYRGKVLRPSMVKVARNSRSDDEQGDEANE